ncbi:hypothetical protein BC938DRAFT_482248 [Jimgerdemannia flammicorona]|uniref:Uncharacterized protein n=1 Tax=Jimgerdemannia flammicorona TaxID=994334 RepID=A0A433QEB4_9FUNG|nr:hypothetical protein BC938DRAFT_482248 [Jimgerdemannia flammicorona]
MKQVISSTNALRAVGNHQDAEQELKTNGLIGITNPLWNLPHINIYNTITPDFLHQVKKGVWEHIITWFKLLIRTQYGDVWLTTAYLTEFDTCFSLIPHFHGLKHFPYDISQLSQTTASEFASIMKILLACA